MNSIFFSFTKPQYESAITVLKRTCLLARKSAKQRKEKASGQTHSQSIPKRLRLNGANHAEFNFFAIDGTRGSGKSTLAEGIAQIAANLDDYPKLDCDDSIRDEVNQICKELAKDENASWPPSNDPNQFTLATVLPAIHPDMFLSEESEVPDVIFDFIREDLQMMSGGATSEAGPIYRQKFYFEKQQREARERHARNRDGFEQPDAKRAEQLLSELHETIDPAWTYARDIGREMLSRDSVSYREFVVRKGHYSSLASRRQSLWFKFIDDYLDMKRSELLLIYLDDCDLSPSIAANVLENIRVYLSHPRVVILLALDTVEVTRLLRERLYQHSAPMLKFLSVVSPDENLESDSLDANFSRERAELARKLADDLVKDEEQITFYLDKVLPRTNRFETGKPNHQDVDRILFDNVSSNEARDRDLSSSQSRSASLDAFLWRTRYPDCLSNFTLRQLTSIRDLTPPDQKKCTREAIAFGLANYAAVESFKGKTPSDFLPSLVVTFAENGELQFSGFGGPVFGDKFSDCFLFLCDYQRLICPSWTWPTLAFPKRRDIQERFLDARLGFDPAVPLDNHSILLPLNVVSLSDLQFVQVSGLLALTIRQEALKEASTMPVMSARMFQTLSSSINSPQSLEEFLKPKWDRLVNRNEGLLRALRREYFFRSSDLEFSEGQYDRFRSFLLFSAVLFAIREQGLTERELGSSEIPPKVLTQAWTLFQDEPSASQDQVGSRGISYKLLNRLRNFLTAPSTRNSEAAVERLVLALALVETKHTFPPLRDQETRPVTDVVKLEVEPLAEQVLNILSLPFPSESLKQQTTRIDARDAAMFCATLADSWSVFDDCRQRSELKAALFDCLDRCAEHPSIEFLPLVNADTSDYGRFDVLREAIELRLKQRRPARTKKSPVPEAAAKLLGTDYVEATRILDELSKVIEG